MASAINNSDPPPPPPPTSTPVVDSSIPVNVTGNATEIPVSATPIQTVLPMATPIPQPILTTTPTSATGVTPSPQSSTSFSHSISAKLTNSNYLFWCQQVEPVLKVHRLHHFLVNLTIPPRFQTLVDRNLGISSPEYLAWESQDQLLLSSIYNLCGGTSEVDWLSNCMASLG